MVTCLLIFPGHVWALWHLQKSAKEDNNNDVIGTSQVDDHLRNYYNRHD